MTDSLLEEFVLLAYDDMGRNTFGVTGLDYGLAGAALAQLALEGMADIHDKRLVVRRAATGDPILDELAAEAAAVKRPKKVRSWISPMSKGLRDKVLRRLVDRGLLRLEKDRVLWVFPRTRYPAGQSDVESRLRDRMEAAIDGAEPDAATASMIALVRAIEKERVVFPGRPVKQLRKRMDEIAAGNWAAAGVKAAIDEVQAALMATVIATSAVATASSS